MTIHVIWALVAATWALVSWDAVRRWAAKAETSALQADLEALRAEIAAERDAKLPARVKQLETVVIALKTHAETQRAARKNPFLKQAGG